MHWKLRISGRDNSPILVSNTFTRELNCCPIKSSNLYSWDTWFEKSKAFHRHYFSYLQSSRFCITHSSIPLPTHQFTKFILAYLPGHTRIWTFTNEVVECNPHKVSQNFSTSIITLTS